MGAKQMKCLSSTSPAHSPKEEYVITKSTDTAAEEAVHERPEKQGEPQQDKSEQTERKSAPEEVSLCGLCPSLGYNGQEEEKSWEEQLDAQQEQLEKEMQEARRMVFRLQGLLLQGVLPEDDKDGSMGFAENRASADQQLVLIRSRLDQSMEEALDLKRELLRHKQETRHIQAIKDALQQRLALQEDAVLQLKQDLLRCNMAKDQLERENEELKRKLSERDKLLNEHEQHFGRKERILQQQKLDEAQHKAHEVSHGRSFRGESRSYRDSVTSTSPPSFQHNAPGEELQLVREALRSLRDSFSGHDPQHHTLDTLEQGVSSLMDRLHSLETQRRQDRGEEFRSPGRRANSTDRDSWPPSSKMAHSHSSPGLDAAVSTKVLYFTDRSLTPFLINIPKRLGEVTLRDFKAAVDRQGNFRYHFKALDPEFGTVKEEVFQDSAVVPGWEGKIVAWVEEDHGERR
ncbi:dixin-A-like isoform X1 [Oryzias latipes]|uniref:DIX domain containing 1a n=1 Tax=Oryzias latipes TaxID=8090 RepID=H2LK67_ORYLA|nr:dixin-A-like isoform X1 [Oryzias latipes]XP_011480727.1 dixin-A-like isoform X1 [Oryzias latipes]